MSDVCQGCSRHVHSLEFVCPSCVTLRLKDHNDRRSRIAEATVHASTTALALLHPPPSNHHSHTNQRVSQAASLTDERITKATKFYLASRLRDLREASASIRVELDNGKTNVAAKKEELQSRYARVREGRLRFGPKATARVESEKQHSDAAWIEKWKAFLSDREEILSRMSENLLFIFDYANDSITDPFETSKVSPATIHGHSIPPLSPQLITTPQTTLELVLSQLATLLRLLALYRECILPFNLTLSGVSDNTSIRGNWYIVWSGFARALLDSPINQTESRTSIPIYVLSMNVPAPQNSRRADKRVARPSTRVKGMEIISESGIMDKKERKEKTRPGSINHTISLQRGYTALAYCFAYMLWAEGYGIELEDIGDVGGMVGKVLRFGPTSTVKEAPHRFFSNEGSRADPDILFPFSFEEVYLHFFPAVETLDMEPELIEVEKEEEWDII